MLSGSSIVVRRVEPHSARVPVLIRVGRELRPAWLRARKVPTAIEAAVELASASRAVGTGAGDEVTALFGTPVDAAVLERPLPIDLLSRRRAADIGRIVERVSGVLPWQPRCFPQAIATRRMLARRRIPSRGHLGVVHRTPLSTHAWVSVGDSVVQGGPVAHIDELCALE